jgi:hypothetical protein
MNTLRKVRLIILAVIGIPTLLFMGGMAVYEYVAGDGHLHLVAPEDAELSYVIDGRPAKKLAPGVHENITLPQGEHVVKLSSDIGQTERKVKISSGFAQLLVPAHDGQCFVLLDVSKSHYGNAKTAKQPKLLQRISASTIADLPSSTHFGEASLPSSIKDDESCDLLETVDCGVLSKDDGELLVALGY